MGRRGAKAAFLAAKYVFPGGGLDPADQTEGLTLGHAALGARCAARLAVAPPPDPLAIDPAPPAPASPAPAAFAAAALRETREETGLTLALPAPTPSNATGPLRFVFRAITPPGRPRRYDARFFLAEADRVLTNPDTPDTPDGELSDLRWFPLAEARSLDLPFVTAVMLAEVAMLARLHPDEAPTRVAFIDNRTNTPRFHWID